MPHNLSTYDSYNYFHPYLVFRNQVLGESSILVRAPALEIMNCISNTDLSNPAVRYSLSVKTCPTSINFHSNFPRIRAKHFKTMNSNFLYSSHAFYKKKYIIQQFNNTYAEKYVMQFKCIPHRKMCWTYLFRGIYFVQLPPPRPLRLIFFRQIIFSFIIFLPPHSILHNKDPCIFCLKYSSGS